jgi:hypothetical protein
MFNEKTIKFRVMEAVNSRIKSAEKKFTEKCDEIDREAFTKKEDVANQLVVDILNGKEINA